MGYQKVARASDIPSGRGLCVSVDGIDVGLFRVGKRVFAMENRCPHAGDPLSEGVLEKCVVTCSAHGWDFDVRTGFRPDDADGFPIPCFAVRIDESDVYVDIEAVINMPPRSPSARPKV
ncbi:MAG: Rieske 2Fe-2S domain-containing protein [Deltaproteobacteria bacterium]|nr:Rieske 2Fe-2S domain-containing protein [Deltaproteobacteria bacterium]MBW2384356.1 Rieske 2Fe-2S domain-containing protein [Deltaproteobacteria bacterium]MBW2696789.1 Rieske 2Fe-2S domain-containing protein [Deltaproteobacteria bacterium]